MTPTEAARELRLRLTRGSAGLHVLLPSEFETIAERFLSEYEQSKWVSADKPPKDTRDVLGVDKWGTRTIVSVRSNRDGLFVYVNGDGECVLVTHWQSLPEGPNVTNQKQS